MRCRDDSLDGGCPLSKCFYFHLLDLNQETKLDYGSSRRRPLGSSNKGKLPTLRSKVAVQTKGHFSSKEEGKLSSNPTAALKFKK